MTESDYLDAVSDFLMPLRKMALEKGEILLFWNAVERLGDHAKQVLELSKSKREVT